jgi:hypothetical protein
MARKPSKNGMVERESACGARVKANQATARGRSATESLEANATKPILPKAIKRVSRRKRVFRVMKDKELIEKIEAAVKNFKGDALTLETAIGSFFLGRQLGWKPLLLIHNKATVRKYEKILGFEFRDHLPEVGELAKKSKGWRAAQNITNFWKAVAGTIPGVRSSEIDSPKEK